VTREFPTEEEIKDVEKHIENTICKYNNKGNMYFVGGTARTALKTYNYIVGENKNYIDVGDLSILLDFISSIPKEELKEMYKTRYDSIFVGIIIMKKIAEIYEKDKIYIKKNGVREGYLKKKEMNL